MQAAGAQQHFRGRGSVAASLSPRSAEQLRQSFNHRLYAIKLSNACRMYGVVQPAEKEGYRQHCALFDAELAGRLSLRHARHCVRGGTTVCAPSCRLGRGVDDARDAQALAITESGHSTGASPGGQGVRKLGPAAQPSEQCVCVHVVGREAS